MKKKSRKKKQKFEPFEMTAASATDCTGLISRAAHSRDEWESYNDIVKFAPPQTE